MMTLVKCAKLANKALLCALRETERKKGRPCVLFLRSTRQETTDWVGTQEKDKKGTEIRSDAVSLRTTDAPKST